jgi:hypothetical protein
MIPRVRLDAMDEAAIRQLIEHGVRESRTVDYKVDIR